MLVYHHKRKLKEKQAQTEMPKEKPKKRQTPKKKEGD